MTRLWILIAAIAGASGVIADAVSRHGMGADPQAAEWLATGARYALIHGAVLLALAVLPEASRPAARVLGWASGWCFVAALLLFSGGLYALAGGIMAVYVDGAPAEAASNTSAIPIILPVNTTLAYLRHSGCFILSASRDIFSDHVSFATELELFLISLPP